MDDLNRFCCLNPDCSDYGRRGSGHPTVADRYGPDRRRLLRCRTRKARFSERKGTPVFDTRLSPAKALALLRHRAAGGGVRPTSRPVGANENTALRLGLQAGGHAQPLPDELVAFSPADPEGSTR